MASTESITQQRIEIANEYFRRVDNGDPAVVDLMTDDVQMYFPKFGIGYGKEAFGKAAGGLMTSISSIKHDFDRMKYIASGDYLIAEGFEGGTTPDGGVWPVPGLSEGRFCNVFVFNDLLIQRVHIYTDPDFASENKDGFHWGSVGMTTQPQKD